MLTFIYQNKLSEIKLLLAIFDKMNSGTNKLYSSIKGTGFTALMCLLAILLLVVSCPLKRLLLTSAGVTTSSVSLARTTQTNINQRSYSDNNLVSCEVANNKVNFTNIGSASKIKIPVPLYNDYISGQTGFSINYFLSGLGGERQHLFISSSSSSIPLFLQNKRLLI